MIQDCIKEVLKVAIPIIANSIVDSLNGKNIKPIKVESFSLLDSSNLQSSSSGEPIILNLDPHRDENGLIKPIKYN